jgi:hypothetical protein
MGFNVSRFPTIRKGEQAKRRWKIKENFFEQWVIDHPIVPWQNNKRWILKWNPSFYFHKWKYKSKSIVIIVPFNQLPLLPLPFVVFNLNPSTNQTINYNWPCIIFCFPFSSLCNIWDVMNFVISIFYNSISFTTYVKLLMASIIVNEPMNNRLFFISNFLLGFLYTPGNLHALVLGLSKLVDGVVPTFALSSPNNLSLRAIKHLRCLGILFIITNIHNFSLKIHHTHTLIYGIRNTIYFGSTRKNVVKTFKPWLIIWRCTNYFNFLLVCFVYLLHCISFVSNLLPIPSHIIWKTCIHGIYECFLVVLLKWLAIVFPIFVFHKV